MNESELPYPLVIYLPPEATVTDKNVKDIIISEIDISNMSILIIFYSFKVMIYLIQLLNFKADSEMSILRASHFY